MMRAVTLLRFGGPEVMQITNVPRPVPSEGETLVRILAAGVNRAEVLQRKGMYPPPKGASDILGLEFAGEMTEDKGNLRKGQKVMGIITGGGYAEYVSVPVPLLMPVPESLSIEEAAGIPEVWLTAYQLAFLLGKAKEGQKVLVQAAGSGVGTALLQLLKDKGVEVWASSRTESKVQRLKEMGAFVGDGKNFDLILDPVGASTLEQNVDRLSANGTIVVYGFMGGAKVPNFNMARLLQKQATLMFSSLRARSLQYKADLVERFVEDRVLDKITEGKLRTVVDVVDDWTNVKLLHERMENNENFGKIVMRIQN